MTHDLPTSPPHPPASRLLADLLSYVVSPLALPVLALSLAAAALGAAGGERWAVTLAALAAHGLLPLLFLIWYVRRGEARTIEVRQRTKRTVPYLFGIACVVVLAAGFALWLPYERRALAWIEATQALNTLLLLVINLRWKISVHLTALAGTFGLLAALVAFVPMPLPEALPPALLAGLALLMPALAWARVHAGAHTWGQTLGGTLFGLTVVPVEILALHGMGLV